MTGLAQVSGRNTISWEEKFEDDIQYVKTISFLMDWKIIFRTVWKVLKREDISPEDSSIMDGFRGSKENINN